MPKINIKSEGLVLENCELCKGAGGRYWRHEIPPTYHICELCVGAGAIVIDIEFDFREYLSDE